MSRAGSRDTSAGEGVALERRRAVYSRPRLERLGDVRTRTLGNSPGIPDSGGGMSQLNQP